MIDKEFTIGTLQKLVQINSVNHSLEAGAAGEAEISRYIHHRLQEMNIDAAMIEAAPGRYNVTAIIEGTGRGPSFMLNAHTDTVGVKGMDRPFSGTITDGKLYGRGSYDMKGSIAAILAAAKSIKENNIRLPGDLVLSFVADEEYESIGAQTLVKNLKTDTAIVAEPTDLKLCTAHRGFGIWKITTKGKTAHGGNHHLGRDANMFSGLIMGELFQLAKTLPTEKHHQLCGDASLHVPLVNGGRSLFIYSDECEIHAERRTLPGETREQVESELLEILERLKAKHSEFDADMELLIWRSPFEIDHEMPVVQKAAKALHEVTGTPPDYIGHTWWEDSAIFDEAGIETVILGPKGGGIHEDVEWVEVDSVLKLAEIFKVMAEQGLD